MMDAQVITAIGGLGAAIAYLFKDIQSKHAGVEARLEDCEEDRKKLTAQLVDVSETLKDIKDRLPDPSEGEE